MEEIKPNNPLLEDAKNTLRKIVGDESHYTCYSLPTIESEVFETLKDKKIIMVDDSDVNFAKFIPHLVAATNGSADGIMVRNEEAQQLVEIILTLKPDAILLDNNFGLNYQGPDIVRLLKSAGYSGKIIGFSNSRQSSSKFIEAGADGFIMKDYDEDICLQMLARIVAK